MLQLYDREDDPQDVDGKGQTDLVLAARRSLSGITVRKRTETIVLRSSPSMKRKRTRGEHIALWGAAIAALGVIAYWIVVTEFRHAAEAAPKTTASLASEATGSEPGLLVGEFAASVEELRARYHVTLIPASEAQKTFAKIPTGSYGFVFGPYLAHSPTNALEMYTHNNPSYFEMHKLTDGQAEFVADVAPETQERLRKGLGKGEKLTLYSL